MINWDKFDEHLGCHDKVLILEIINMFINDYADNLSALKKSVIEKDFKNLDGYAHSIKSNCATFGDMECAKLAYNLELMGKMKEADNAKLKGLLDSDTWDRLEKMAKNKLEDTMNEVFTHFAITSKNLIEELEQYKKIHYS